MKNILTLFILVAFTTIGYSQCPTPQLSYTTTDSCNFNFNIQNVDTNQMFVQIDMGDGTYYNGVTFVSHSYAPANGVFTVTAYVWDGASCSDTLTQVVYANCNPGTPCNGYLDVQTTDSCNYTFNLVNVSPGASTYWEMGDGTNYNNTNTVSHQYSGNGMITAVLYYYDGVCSDTIYTPLYIDCDTTTVNCNASLDVQMVDSCDYVFTVNGISPGSNVYWDFGDGTYDNSNSNPVTHQYFTNGVVYPTVTYFDGMCSDTLVWQIYTDCDTTTTNCNGYLDVQTTDSCNYTFNLVNVSPGASTYWEMGDGTNYNNTNTVSHQYSGNGMITAVLYYYDGVCSDTIYTPLNIDCDTTNYSCNQYIDVQWVDSCIYTFTLVNENPGATIEWSMGDGSIFSNVNPVTYEFNSSGIHYPVVYYNDGVCEDTMMTQVYTYCDTVNTGCNGYLDVQTTDSCTYTFTLVNVAQGASTYWSTGNGNYYNNTNTVTETYYGQGVADIEIAYWDMNGCSDTILFQLGYYCNDSTASISDFEEVEFNVYPNPANDKVTITGVQSFEMYNALGRLVAKDNSNILQVTELPNGVYIIKGQLLNGEFATKRIVISH